MRRIKDILVLYLSLVKHRLSLMVTFSAWVGYVILPNKDISSIWSLLIGVYLLSGGAAALNEYQERNEDALMKRTRTRPIPSGLMPPRQGFYSSIILILVGSLMLLSNGVWPAVLGLLNVVIYNGIYTPMKQRTSYAVLPGALVGAVPPMIGWTSGGGDLFNPIIIYVAAFMFLWQMPHFWLLLLKFGKEYETAGFSILTRKLGEEQLKRMIFFWIGITSLFLVFFPLLNNLILPGLIPVLILLNVGFIIWFYHTLFKKEAKKQTRNAFIAINFYMMLVLLLIVLNGMFG